MFIYSFHTIKQLTPEIFCPNRFDSGAVFGVHGNAAVISRPVWAEHNSQGWRALCFLQEQPLQHNDKAQGAWVEMIYCVFWLLVNYIINIILNVWNCRVTSICWSQIRASCRRRKWCGRVFIMWRAMEISAIRSSGCAIHPRNPKQPASPLHSNSSCRSTR